MKNLYESTESKNYIVCWDADKKHWELRGKLGKKTFFMNSSIYAVPLLALQKELESKKKCQSKIEKHRQKNANT